MQEKQRKGMRRCERVAGELVAVVPLPEKKRDKRLAVIIKHEPKYALGVAYIQLEVADESAPAIGKQFEPTVVKISFTKNTIEAYQKALNIARIELEKGVQCQSAEATAE